MRKILMAVIVGFCMILFFSGIAGAYLFADFSIARIQRLRVSHSYSTQVCPLLTLEKASFTSGTSGMDRRHQE